MVGVLWAWQKLAIQKRPKINILMEGNFFIVQGNMFWRLILNLIQSVPFLCFITILKTIEFSWNSWCRFQSIIKQNSVSLICLSLQGMNYSQKKWTFVNQFHLSSISNFFLLFFYLVCKNMSVLLFKDFTYNLQNVLTTSNFYLL